MAVDPVLRCDSCQKIMQVKTLQQIGMCPHCGHRKVRNCLMLKPDEVTQAREWGYDDFVNLFEAVEVDG